MQKKKSSKTLVWAIIAVLLCAGGFAAVRAFRAPLAPTMTPPAASPVESATQPAASQPAVDQPTEAPTQAPAPVCGQTGSMTVLFLGSDASSGNPPYGADSVRLIKVDFDAQKITVVSFPRDMIVQTAALNNASYPQAPLGISFKYASQAASGTALEKNAAAAGIVAQILADDFGAASDHYITVEMSQLSAMIDTLGGVDITIPETITTERGVTFTAGAQTLNGALATEYVRAIQPGGDAARTLRQNEFLKALQAKVISAGTLTKIPALLTQFKDAVATDLSPEQLVNIACLADKVGKDSVTFATVDQPQLMSSTTANVDAIRSFLIQTLGE